MRLTSQLLHNLMPLILFSITLLLSAPAMSANIGNRDRGLLYAQQICAGCHAVEAQQHLSPLAAATPFQTISEVRGMTEMALRVFFRTPHKNMPNLIVAGEDQDNVIAYILSLKPKQ